MWPVWVIQAAHEPFVSAIGNIRAEPRSHAFCTWCDQWFYRMMRKVPTPATAYGFYKMIRKVPTPATPYRSERHRLAVGARRRALVVVVGHQRNRWFYKIIRKVPPRKQRVWVLGVVFGMGMGMGMGMKEERRQGSQCRL